MQRKPTQKKIDAARRKSPPPTPSPEPETKNVETNPAPQQPQLAQELPPPPDVHLASEIRVHPRSSAAIPPLLKNTETNPTPPEVDTISLSLYHEDSVVISHPAVPPIRAKTVGSAKVSILGASL
ncbi:MAG: hypothetical protein FJW20_05085 [Acidimicrobiia bacterium]|nr:hypothetical protein [Acidimicrobiia bacterium]